VHCAVLRLVQKLFARSFLFLVFFLKVLDQSLNGPLAWSDEIDSIRLGILLPPSVNHLYLVKLLLV